MSGLRKVTIENGVKTISAKAFEGCKELETVAIPSSVEKIDLGAFDGCSSLKSVEIPASVTTIGTMAFANCPELTLTVVKGSSAHTYAENNSINYKFKDGEIIENPTETSSTITTTKPSTTKPTTIPTTTKPSTTKPSTTQPTTKKSIVSISVEKLPAKTSYNYKAAIDSTGLEIEVLYSDGSTEIVTDGYRISPSTCTERGTQTVTVEYQGKTAEFNVSVSFAWWQWLIWFVALGFLWY
jgi:hypothetical protein